MSSESGHFSPAKSGQIRLALTKGLVWIYDWQGSDYKRLLSLTPLIIENKSVPWCSDVFIDDLNNDGREEVLTEWYDGSTTGFEKYIGIVGWDGQYYFVGTLPEFKCTEAEGSMIPPAGLDIQLSFQGIGVNDKQNIRLANTTHLVREDINGDSKNELLCAHIIWNMTPAGLNGFAESRGSDHSYIIRILGIDSPDNKLEAVRTWNHGNYMFVGNKKPAYDFVFDDTLIEAGKQSPYE